MLDENETITLARLDEAPVPPPVGTKKVAP